MSNSLDNSKASKDKTSNSLILQVFHLIAIKSSQKSWDFGWPPTEFSLKCSGIYMLHEGYIQDLEERR